MYTTKLYAIYLIAAYTHISSTCKLNPPPLSAHPTCPGHPCRRPHRVQQPPPHQVVLVQYSGVYASIPHKAHRAQVAVGAAYNS